MRRFIIPKMIGIFLFLIISVCWYISMVYYHENVHRVIAGYDGCKSYHIGFRYYQCTDPDYIESGIAQLSHNILEIVDYMSILIFGLGIITYYMLKLNEL